MTSNGPRTEALEERLRRAGIELEKRITVLETNMKIIVWVGTFFATIISGVLVLEIIGLLHAG